MDFGSFFTAHVGPGSDGRAFEDAVRWWLESDPFYAAQVKKAWLWRDWPGCWGADIGIDVVAETHSGELWAVQAKAYAGSVPKREIDSFISASATPEFSFRLLVTSGDSLGRNALKVFEAHSDRAYVCRDGLEESRVDWQQFLDRQKGQVVDRKTLRPHQVEAVQDVIEGFKDSERGQLIMACGSGKTLTSLKIVEESGADLVLALFPSLLLLQQSMHEWLAEAETAFSVIAVCSDERVSRGDDVAVSHTSEIGIPVTTDPEVVAGFLNGTGRRIVFATYQSSNVVAEAQKTSGAVFDLAVCDEAHRCATATDSVFRTVLDDRQIRCVKRLFMTATPKIYTAAVKTKANEASMIHGLDLDVVSMDDETVFGPVLHRLSLNAAIDQGILTDYQVVVIGCLESEVEEMIANGTLVQNPIDGKVTDARTVGRSIGLLKAMRTYGMRRAITFHSRVKLASRFAQELPATSRALPTGDGPESDVWCGHVSGSMPTDARKRILRQLREVSGYGIVSNAQCLKEGVDVPSLDGVAFIDPRSSHVDIVQAVGRAIRTSPDKKIGTILIPVVINEHDDPEQALEGSEFNRIWEVIRSLRSHDDTLAEQIDQIRYQLGKTGDSTDTRLDKLILDLPVKLDIQRFSNAIQLRLIEQTSTSWRQWIGAYEAFYDQNQHGRVPAKYKTETGLNLGAWVNTQRTGRGRLSPERKAEVDSLPGWDWDPHETQWRENVAAYMEFYDQNQHGRVPAKYKTETGLSLGTWVNNQRTGRDRLSPERKAEVEALPGWDWHPHKTQWQQNSAAYLEFYDLNQHGRIPQGYKTETGLKLGKWVSDKRSQKEKISPERRAELEALPGWLGDPLENQWRKNIAVYLEFYDQNGHGRVPAKYKTETGLNLGAWVNTQRTGRGRLSPERKAEVDSLPGWDWDPHETQWRENVAAYMEFYDQNQHGRVPAKYKTETGLSLGAWVATQRRGRDKLSEERRAELDALPGWIWSVRGNE